jgi:hypothetical protein
MGLFARAPVREGEVVSIIGGDVMTNAEFEAFAASATRYNAIQIGQDAHLVEAVEVTAREEGSLNHARDSNLWMTDEVTLAARRDIGAGEELTVDYALFTALPVVVIEVCRCGSPVCRGTVTGDDWRLPALQERYRGHSRRSSMTESVRGGTAETSAVREASAHRASVANRKQDRSH